MTWADFYLVCFAVGFAFTVLSFLMGGVRLHLPHAGLPHVHVGHVPAGSGHGVARGSAVSPFNLFTLAAFLAWFGGSGYLMTRYSRLQFTFGLAIAVVLGLVGATIVFLFLSRMLTSKEESLDPADFEMVGVLAKVSMPIRPEGTGEIIYSQAGTRRACGARAEDSSAMAKGTEVIVTRYEKGIAYVRPWSEMAGEDEAPEPGA